MIGKMGGDSVGRTSSAVKNRYNAKAYDQLPIRVPKGKKAAIDAYAKERGESVNGLVNNALREMLGMSEEEWKTVTDETGEA